MGIIAPSAHHSGSMQSAIKLKSVKVVQKIFRCTALKSNENDARYPRRQVRRFRTRADTAQGGSAASGGWRGLFGRIDEVLSDLALGCEECGEHQRLVAELD
jgi:hypothetical protein